MEALPAKLRAVRESLTGAIADVDVLLEMLDDVDREHGAFTREELQSVEDKLLDAAVSLAPLDQGLPDSGTATLVFCGALAPIAEGLRLGAGAEELRRDVARLGAAAVTFLIALSHPGPTVAQLDSARRHLIVAVLHGDRGVSRVDVADIDAGRWFLRAVAALGELMAEGSTGPRGPVVAPSERFRAVAGRSKPPETLGLASSRGPLLRCGTSARAACDGLSFTLPGRFDRWRTARNRWASGVDCRAFVAHALGDDAVCEPCHRCFMSLSQEDFERVVGHCAGQLVEHGRNVDDQLDVLGLDADGIAVLAEAVDWEGADTPAERRIAAVGMRFGILIGAQLHREGLLKGDA